jgi:phage-related protein
VSPKDKPLVWLHGEVESPPLSREARVETGFLLRRLQRVDLLSLPASRPMPIVGPRCHELRIKDVAGDWRLMYPIDVDAILISEVFARKMRTTPKAVIETCQKRLKEYDHARK